MHIFPTLLNKGVVSSAFLGHTVKTSLWHQRFDHPSNKLLVTILKDSNKACTSDEYVKFYSHCKSGKMSRLSFIDIVCILDTPFYRYILMFGGLL